MQFPENYSKLYCKTHQSLLLPGMLINNIKFLNSQTNYWLETILPTEKADLLQ